MLREGPIPRFAHGLIEYLGGAFFIAAPFVLSFHSGAATAVAIAMGVVILVLAASTDGPTSLVNQIPVPAHFVLDFGLAILAVAMPFIAGFSDEAAPTAFFIVMGVGHILMTIGTRFRKRAEPAGG